MYNNKYVGTLKQFSNSTYVNSQLCKMKISKNGKKMSRVTYNFTKNYSISRIQYLVATASIHYSLSLSLCKQDSRNHIFIVCFSLHHLCFSMNASVPGTLSRRFFYSVKVEQRNRAYVHCSSSLV